jgi:hypothetical protein
VKPIDLRAIDRAVHGPAAVARATRQLTHGALDNARRSFEEITRSVQDRRYLQDVLSEPREPGDLGVLDREECLRLLSTRSVGRLAYVARAGVPDIVPVNYVVTGGQLLIRSGSGPKLQAAERTDTVAFEVDDVDERTRSGWSVVVTGRLSVVPLTESSAGALPEPWATGPRRHLMRLQLGRVSGRRLIGGTPRDDDA